MSASSPKRYTLRLLGTVIAVLLLTVFLTTLVNPVRVTPTPWSLDLFNRYRVVEHFERTAKSGYIRSGDWDAAIFGSSRMDIAIDPAAPAFAGYHAVNLSLSAGHLTENIEMLRYAMAHEHLGMVMYGVDLMDLSTPVKIPKSDFYSSPLAIDGGRLDHELQYLIGITSLKHAVTVISRTIRGKPSEHSPSGHWIKLKNKPDQRRDAERSALSQAFALFRTRREADSIDLQKADMMREVLALCRSSNSRLIIVIPPSHAIFNASLHLLGDPDPVFRTEREFLTRLVAEDNAHHPNQPVFTLWDFDDFHPLNCEPVPADPARAMKEWVDAIHACDSIGAIMSGAALGHPSERPDSAGYGYELTPENLDSRIANIQSGYERYTRENADELAWLRTVLDHLKSEASDLLPSDD
ncbi:MAG: hypothetical protein WC205_03595 [Opitutaceae bacterium]|jgi:hypothetical protein